MALGEAVIPPVASVVDFLGCGTTLRNISESQGCECGNFLFMCIFRCPTDFVESGPQLIGTCYLY